MHETLAVLMVAGTVVGWMFLMTRALRRQRDEARRIICYDEACKRYECGHPECDEEAVAKEYGWDCYKEGSKLWATGKQRRTDD